MTEKIMRQVTMTRAAAPGEERGRQQVCWIDCDRARVGARVRSKEDDQMWTVIEIYGARPLSLLQSQEDTRRNFVEVLGGDP